MRKSTLLSRRITNRGNGFSLLAHLEESVQTTTGTTLASSEWSNTNEKPPVGSRQARLYKNKGSTAEGESFLFENNKYDIIECNNKAAWADHRTGYCHLCREPIGGSIGIHIGDRDHTSMQVCMIFSSIYPRSWKPKELFNDIRSSCGMEVEARPNGNATRSSNPRVSAIEMELRRKLFSPVLAFATNSNNCDHLHAYDDTKRRAELESLILHLIDGGTMSRIDSSLTKWSSVPEELLDEPFQQMRLNDARPAAHTPTMPLTALVDAPLNLDAENALVRTRRPPNAVLTHSIVEPNGSFPFWYSGERMWKRHMIKMITMMFPPMQAGVLTNFSQKCWGRVNGERMFDALHIQNVRKSLNLPLVPENKERKAFFVRAILWELVSAKMRPGVTPATEALIEITIRRFCFELIFLQTMVYMNKVQDVVESMEYAEFDELKRLNLW